MLGLDPRERDSYFMTKALNLAQRAFDEGEVPVGCIIVYQGKIIAQAYNQVERLSDVTAHAEMIALTQAESYLNTKWLRGCVLYVTIEPCIMCSYAVTLSRLDQVVLGAAEQRTGGLGSVIDVNRYSLNPEVKVKRGVLEKDCKLLMQRFFQERRGIKK
jgi:tRNA(adenine34) deaminase